MQLLIWQLAQKSPTLPVSLIAHFEALSAQNNDLGNHVSRGGRNRLPKEAKGFVGDDLAGFV